jgi:hypothetical protein
MREMTKGQFSPKPKTKNLIEGQFKGLGFMADP